VEAFLRKYLWAVDLAVAAVCAVLLAWTAGSIAEIEFAALAPDRASHPVRVSPGSGETYDKAFEPIVDRNIFCSNCPPPEPEADLPLAGGDALANGMEGGEGASGDASEDGLIADTASAEKTELPLALVAIMYAPPPTPPWHSLAVVRDTELLGAGAYVIGDTIRDAKIIEIDEQRIYFDNSGKLEYLDLLEEPKPEKKPEKKSKSKRKRRKKLPQDELAKDLERGLKKVGEHQYELQRDTLEQVLGNMSLLSRSARIVPEVRDGKPAGFRLYSVRPTGPFAAIGMQNGDVIYAINGLEMSSPEKALAVYSKLKSAGHLSVSLERGGKKINKEYTIR